jgi:hypothetical protein
MENRLRLLNVIITKHLRFIHHSHLYSAREIYDTKLPVEKRRHSGPRFEEESRLLNIIETEPLI